MCIYTHYIIHLKRPQSVTKPVYSAAILFGHSHERQHPLREFWEQLHSPFALNISNICSNTWQQTQDHKNTIQYAPSYLRASNVLSASHFNKKYHTQLHLQWMHKSWTQKHPQQSISLTETKQTGVSKLHETRTFKTAKNCDNCIAMSQ